MSRTREGLVVLRKATVKMRRGPERRSLEHVSYENVWDQYARDWRLNYPKLAHIGDEWTGEYAGAAKTVDEYCELIESRYISPHVTAGDQVLEIGVGGGKTSALLKKHCGSLICADISSEMLNATHERIGDEAVQYVKVDGIKLAGISAHSVDVCFCFDTMVHMEPRDIFNYLTQIPALMRGKRLCIFHHTNTLSELGWRRFLWEWDKNLMGRSGGSFSVMTIDLMARFLEQLNYEVIAKDSESIPRDCVWIVRAPEK